MGSSQSFEENFIKYSAEKIDLHLKNEKTHIHPYSISFNISLIDFIYSGIHSHPKIRLDYRESTDIENKIKKIIKNKIENPKRIECCYYNKKNKLDDIFRGEFMITVIF